MLKQNLGLAPDPFGFSVTDKGLAFGEAPRKRSKNTQKQKAEEWLQDHLANGEWHLRDEVMECAKQFDYSTNAIQRAREELGITLNDGTIRKRPTDTRYEWRLPKSRGN